MAENEKNENKKNQPQTEKEPKITGAERPQRRLFKKKRGGAVLSEGEVIEIKQGRKKLRAEMKAMGIKSRKEFELTASSLGLYFDKQRGLALLGWFLFRRGGWILLGSALALMFALFGLSAITQMRGHFTINMTQDLFKEGFLLYESSDFENSSGAAHLFSTPAEDVPCISITDIPGDVDDIDGEHNGNYFAYTYYIINEGDKVSGYEWELRLNSESKNLSKAAWVMIFEDGKMTMYAKAREDGTNERIPAEDDDTHGYLLDMAMYHKTKDPESQFEIARQTNNLTYWRLTPKPFESDVVAVSGAQTSVQPGEYHKYTIVIWLEGDDPDCTNELIGGHLGFEMYMSLIEKSE